MIRALALGLVLAVWAGIAYGNRVHPLVEPALLPSPGEVAVTAAAAVADGSLARHVAISLGRVIQGFGAAALGALALGILVGLCVPLRLALEPIVEFIRPIPPLAFLPMFLVWFGLGETSKVAFIAYTTFFPMFVGVASSLWRVDPLLLRAAASLGASRAALLRDVALGLALFVIVGAEFIGADAGLGHLIMEGRVFFNPAQIVMGALLLGVLGTLVNTLLVAVERRAVRGHGA